MLKQKLGKKHYSPVAITLLLLLAACLVCYLASDNGLKLVKKPLKEKLIDIKAYVVPNACYYGAGGGMASYLEGVSFDEFMIYGRPARFEYGPHTGPPGRAMLLESFRNMGYEDIHGLTNKNISLQDFYQTSIDEKNVKVFDSEKSAFNFVKKLVSSGTPVIVRINVKPLAPYSKNSFKILAGYDEDDVYLSWEPYEGEGTSLLEEPNMISPKPYPIKDFLEAWRMQDHIFLWFEKHGEKKSEQEIMRLNKEDAKNACKNIQRFIQGLESGADDNFLYYDDGTITRMALSRKLAEKGFLKSAERYELAAQIYNQKNKGVTESFSRIHSLEKEAADLWA